MTEEQAEYRDELWGEPKQVITELSGFVPVFDCVLERYKNLTKAAVHGAMWRFSRMKDGVCRASLSKIGDKIGVDKATVLRYAKELCKDGYFLDTTPNLKNKPHIYADTGAVSMISKFCVAQNNTRVAQNNATVAENQLKKVNNKDSNKHGAYAPQTIEEAIYAGVPVTENMLGEEAQKHAQMVDSANLIATGLPAAYDLALSFMEERGIVIPLKKAKGQRKVCREMLEMGVKEEHVRFATSKLVALQMTVVDLYAISKTAIDLANKIKIETPAQDQSWKEQGWRNAI
jgi:hypothetical protein